MKQILTLLSSDYWELRRWFQRETFSKVFVAFGFIIIVALISTVLYGVTSIFFRGLARYETYGLLSANYLFHAGLIILFGLITLLSTVSFCTFLFSSRRKMNSLLVFPFPSYVIPGWLFIREMVVSFLFFLFFLTPCIISFYRYFVESDMVSYVISSISVLLVLSSVTPLLGMGCGLLLCWAFQKNKKVTILFLAIFFLSVGYVLSQLIFPVSLRSLYHATPEEFENIYNSLPLSNAYLPTSWLVKGITQGNLLYVLPFLSGTLILFVIIQHVAARNFSSVYRRLFDKPFHSPSSAVFDKTLLTTKWPLLYKDLLSIIRVSHEGGYAVFLIALTFVFFLFLLFARQFRSETYDGASTLLVFYFVAFLFYTIAYLLRMVFPLMAKEGRATWHIFTLPISRQLLLKNKVYASIVLLIPYLVGSFVLWMIVGSDGLLIGVYAVLVILSLMMTAVSCGAIHPNFAESENAEKISTSGMGMLSLFVMLIITAGAAFSLYVFITGQQSLWLLFVPVFCFLGASLLLYGLAKKAVVHYQF